MYKEKHLKSKGNLYFNPTVLSHNDLKSQSFIKI
jgi:hypothetical protein